MYRNSKLLLLLWIFFLAFQACKDDSKPIVRKNTLSNGDQEEFTVLPADTTVRDGYYYRFNAKGDTIEKVTYKNGMIDGQRIIFHNNGNISIVENYTANVYNGPYQSFYEDGAPRQLGAFRNGNFEGELKTYYRSPRGRLKEVVIMKQGVENGPYKQYYESGQIQAEGIYENGYRNGPFKEYHPNGHVAAEGIYVDDLEDQELKVYDSTGTLKKIYVYKDRRPVETINVP